MRARCSALDCFSADRESLFQSFKATCSLRFADFASCWRQSKFSLVLYGRRNRELKEWMTACYAAVSPDLQKFNPIDRRVFGLYLMYGMFFKQPLKEMTPARITIAVLQDIEDVKQFAIREKHLDVLYVWHKLLSSSGLHIVHSARLYGPQHVKSSVKEPSRIVDRLKNDVRSTLDPQLAELSSLQSQYESMKQVLGSTVPAIRDLVDEETDTFTELRDRLHASHFRTGPVATIATSESTKDVTAGAEETIGDKRRRLKNRTKSAI